MRIRIHKISIAHSEKINNNEKVDEMRRVEAMLDRENIYTFYSSENHVDDKAFLLQHIVYTLLCVVDVWIKVGLSSICSFVHCSSTQYKHSFHFGKLNGMLLIF